MSSKSGSATTSDKLAMTIPSTKLTYVEILSYLKLGHHGPTKINEHVDYHIPEIQYE